MISNKAKILIVDDTPANLKLLGGLLTDKYSVFVANSGEHALRLVQQNQPDLILMDVNMPGMNGLETCRTIKNNSLTSDIPIIFLTAMREEEDIVKGFQAGGADYVFKPFRSEELLARVKTHIDLREKSKALLKEQQLMLDNAVWAGMADVARELIHNIGNAMSSLRLSQQLVEEALLQVVHTSQSENESLKLEVQGLFQIQKNNMDEITHWINSHRSLAQVPGFFSTENLADLLKLILAKRSDELKQAQIQVRYKVHGNCMARIQKIKLTDVIQRLLDNAQMALRLSGVEHKELDIILTEKEHRVELVIFDNGCGVEPSKIQWFFARGTSLWEGHLGFGLHFCANAVKEMGGDLQMKSEGLGFGCRMILELKKETVLNVGALENLEC